MTKVDIISGFLGAGKTTLIKKLLNEALKGEKVVLLENEFGEIGIDGGFMKEAGIEITEMNSGCICCSLVGDFETALGQMLDSFKPDRIIIEPSGVGKLSDVVRAVQNAANKNGELVINSKTVVADAKKCKMYMNNFGEFYNNQIENAQTIILSRTGEISGDVLNSCVELILQHNDTAPIITTTWEEITGKRLLEIMEKESGKHALADELMNEEGICPECGHHHDHDHCHHEHDHDHDHEHCHHDHHHHHADEVFASVGIETPKKFSEEMLRNILESIGGGEYGTVLRAKGIIPSDSGEWIHFDYVPESIDIRKGAADYTGRICVIGTQLKEQELRNLFLKG